MSVGQGLFIINYAAYEFDRYEDTTEELCTKVRSVLMQAVEPSAKPEGDWNLNF